jgi:endothelin-converting enzyme/putative endopeptidase
LKKRLKAVDGLKEPAVLAHRLAELALIGSEGLFEFYADQDPKDSGHMIAMVDRGGMSLPDPDYYLKDDAKSKEIRTHYRDHIAKSLRLAGESSSRADKIADHILAFETELARYALKLDDRRDMEKRFHPMSLEELKKLAPSIDWMTYFSALGIQPPAKLNVVEPEFLRQLSVMLARTDADRLAGFLRYKLIHRVAYYLAGPLQKEDFSFWRAYLRGQKEMPPQWKYCTQIIADGMNEGLGQAYLASIPNAKEIRAKTQTMFAEIKRAFGEELNRLKWMDASTRAQAKKKLAKMGSKIGWPEKWRDYSKLTIEKGAFFRNELATTTFEVRRNLDKIGKPTDRSEWFMSVWEPNAYYADSNNEMVLPLGELVPPVFDPRFSDGANYASLGGSTIGHELTHGFDDAGKDMDADGNFVTWWSAKAKKAFDKQSECYTQQTESYEIRPGSDLKIRGKATLGENLADNSGVKLGLIVLKQRMKKRKPAAAFEGFNENQQFFLAYAQGWCTKTSEEKLRDQLLTDFHPPAEFRVNMVLANQPEFAQAFHCKIGTKMAPKHRCSLW